MINLKAELNIIDSEKAMHINCSLDVRNVCIWLIFINSDVFLRVDFQVILIHVAPRGVLGRSEGAGASPCRTMNVLC